MSEPPASRPVEHAVSTAGPVHVVGSGLLGASIGLALARAGVEVTLEDASPAAAALARDVGAGQLGPGRDARVVVVAVPPDVAADVVVTTLREHPDAVVTDVASVKAVVLGEVEAAARDGRIASGDLARYVGSHPMAGRERSGAAAADPDLFAGRPWVVVPHDGVDAAAVLTIRTLAVDLGATPIQLGAREHDQAVAAVSHVPQVVASVLAARLLDAPETALALAGQGLRDTTRIAASDPRLWAAILVGNAGPVADLLAAARADLAGLEEALRGAAEHGPLNPGAMAAATDVVHRGNVGVSRIPGKHGGVSRSYADVTVLVPDRPGQLGRLFVDVGELGVNVEDFAMEHAPRQKVGLATISVLPDAADRLTDGLHGRGWRVVGS
ncbi:prephenate dehydrogenase [Salana multivorans]|uniref:Prephenate dehydrogenase n=1 Tax=Salana multivorans TaxID=120377 RepID=A0A3N2D158_9MICO|nr:prephenate dehydrogenase [Salana multivorans]ROR93491.1 prephenate dehydrogenase [Salana multivorans]